MAEKICRRCNEYKNLDAFNKDKSRKDGLRIYCRQCSKRTAQKHYEENKDYYKQKAKINNNVSIDRNREKLIAYLKDHPCIDCGISDIRLLEFDHVDPTTKLKCIGDMIRNRMSWIKIEKEIAKCEVRCCNCHRLKTYERHGSTWHIKYEWQYCGGIITSK